jgi:nucleotide-binding universal stress UspA family protein
MSYATVMVHLQPGRSNAGLLQLASDLAGRLHAGVIGIAACRPIQVVYSDATVAGHLVEQDCARIEQEIKAAETEFRNHMQSRIDDHEWRSGVSFQTLASYLATEARGVDLLITAAAREHSTSGSNRHPDLGALVMQIGRPVLVVPQEAVRLELDRVVVAWKDTCEARRAIFESLPLLKEASHVAVIEAAGEGDMLKAGRRVTDVVRWLKRHRITAEAVAVPSAGDDAGSLRRIVQEQGADLVVAGAYGHNRRREWVLGGVTRDLLLGGEQCSLVAH